MSAPPAAARRVLEHAQAFFLRHAGLHAAEDAHGVALLEAVERARRGARFDARERGHGHELAARRLDLEIEQRIERRAIRVADLRNHLVAALEVVEAVHVRAAEQRAELAADAREVEAEIGDALAVEHDARLGQVDLEIGVDVQELAALPARADHRAGGLEQLFERRVALHHQLDVVLARRGQRRIETREHAQARAPARRRHTLRRTSLRSSARAPSSPSRRGRRSRPSSRSATT